MKKKKTSEDEEEVEDDEDDEEAQEEDVKVKKTERWTVQDVPTQTQPMVVDVEEGKAYPVEAALVKVLNNQERLMKQLLD